MEEKIEFPVYLEETSELVFLMLSPEEVKNATDDMSYLRQLINKQTMQREENVVSGETTTDMSMNEEIEEQSENIDEKENTGGEKLGKAGEWSEEAVLLFLEIYREKEALFKKAKRHTKIWQEIADEMNIHKKSYCFSGLQCSTKMSGLKRTYKNIKDQNKKSGNSRSTWAFYSVMDSLFSEKAYMVPEAIACSAGPSKRSAASIATAEIPSSSGNTTALSCDRTKKRRVEVVLENFMEHIKIENENRMHRIEEIQRTKDENKRIREKEKNEQKYRMHQENMQFKNALLSLLEKNLQQ